MTTTSAKLREAAAAIAGDILMMRRTLDHRLLGTADYAAALAALVAGIESLQRLADTIDAGQQVGRVTSFGDLVDGELVSGGPR